MTFCKKSRRWPLAVLAARSKEATIYRPWMHRGKVHKVIRLPDFRVEVFKIYMNWLGKTHRDSRGGFYMFRRCTRESELEAKHTEHMLFINLYKLGCSTLEDTRLRNFAVLELSKTEGVRGRLVDHAAWKLLEEAARGVRCRKANREDLDKMIDQYPSAFVQELALAALRKGSITEWLPGGSQYFEPVEPEDDTRKDHLFCH
jgi:hypothetical protein